MRSIIVDNANLRFMLRGLGVHHIDYKILRQILAHEVGQDENGQTPPLAHDPVITVPTIVSSRFVRYLQAQQYECLRYQRNTGEDDRLLIDRIRALDSQVVTQLIIVTSDQDFIPAVKSRHVRGIEVLWVASKAALNAGSQNRMISPFLDLLFDEDETFRFIELAHFVPHLKAAPVPCL